MFSNIIYREITFLYLGSFNQQVFFRIFLYFWENIFLNLERLYMAAISTSWNIV